MRENISWNTDCLIWAGKQKQQKKKTMYPLVTTVNEFSANRNKSIGFFGFVHQSWTYRLAWMWKFVYWKAFEWHLADDFIQKWLPWGRILSKHEAEPNIGNPGTETNTLLVIAHKCNPLKT